MYQNIPEQDYPAESYSADTYSCYNSNYDTLNQPPKLNYISSCFDINYDLFWCGSDNVCFCSCRQNGKYQFYYLLSIL